MVADVLERCRQGREIVVPALAAHSRVTMAPPKAAFYAFFQVEGMNDSLEWAKQLYRETSVGVAPGRAFGPAGEGWIRLCFASSPQALETAMERITGFLDKTTT